MLVLMLDWATGRIAVRLEGRQRIGIDCDAVHFSFSYH
jgi:hypothetical protein